MARILIQVAIVLLMILPAGCSAPPAPPEVELAKAQELDLRRGGAQEYAPELFTAYLYRLERARGEFLRERDGFAPFIDYGPIAVEFEAILEEGKAIREVVQRAKQEKDARFWERLSTLEDSRSDLAALSSAMNERRIPAKHLLKAELALTEARALLGKGKYEAASREIGAAEDSIGKAGDALKIALGRYADSAQLRRWKELVASAVRESRNSGGRVIVVNKLERRLVLYENGHPVKSYRIGIGRNGSADKLRAGDNATPEGSYRITGKKPSSAYHKALPMNYPNEEDRRRFSKARSKGLIPPDASIGGLVEIHGGGSTSVTRGCIALDNRDMDELYQRVAVGTPVVIVGATELDKALAAIIGEGQ